MSTAGLRLGQEGPPRDPCEKILARGLLRVQVVLTVTPPRRAVNPTPAYFVLSPVGVARPVANTCSRWMATVDLMVANQGDARQPPGNTGHIVSAEVTREHIVRDQADPPRTVSVLGDRSAPGSLEEAVAVAVDKRLFPRFQQPVGVDKGSIYTLPGPGLNEAAAI